MENEDADAIADGEAEAGGPAAEVERGTDAPAQAGGTAAEAGGGAEGAVGLPQLDVGTFDNQIFWLVLALVAIYLILTRIALPRIGAVLAERQGTITNDIAAAEDLKRKAAAAEEAYEAALAQARAESKRISEATRAEIQSDLDEAISAADARIAEKSAESEARIAEIRAGAADAVEEVARASAAEIVRKLGAVGDVDEAAIRQAVSNRTGDAA